MIRGPGNYPHNYLCDHNLRKSSLLSLSRCADQLYREVKLLRLMGDSAYFPSLVGMISTSPSIIQEFLGDPATGKSTTLGQQLAAAQDITKENWLRIIQDIGKGLRHMHGKGYLHIDLHLHNIVICRQPHNTRPRAKIVDLGAARELRNTSVF